MPWFYLNTFKVLFSYKLAPERPLFFFYGWAVPLSLKPTIFQKRLWLLRLFFFFFSWHYQNVKRPHFLRCSCTWVLNHKAWRGNISSAWVFISLRSLSCRRFCSSLNLPPCNETSATTAADEATVLSLIHAPSFFISSHHQPKVVFSNEKINCSIWGWLRPVSAMKLKEDVHVMSSWFYGNMPYAVWVGCNDAEPGGCKNCLTAVPSSCSASPHAIHSTRQRLYLHLSSSHRHFAVCC